jgi:hypothetical protein
MFIGSNGADVTVSDIIIEDTLNWTDLFTRRCVESITNSSEFKSIHFWAYGTLGPLLKSFQNYLGRSLFTEMVIFMKVIDVYCVQFP